MIVLVAIILVSTVDCRVLYKDLSDSPVYPEIDDNFVESPNEDFDAVLDVKDDNGNRDVMDFLSQEERIFSDKWNSEADHSSIIDKDRELIQTYILVKRVRQRNKRYVSYLTLCHFKICNIGKKRKPRYVFTMKRANDM